MLAELVDLYPTLADIPAPQGLEGASQKFVLGNPHASVKNAAFSQFQRSSLAHEHGVMVTLCERHTTDIRNALISNQERWK